MMYLLIAWRNLWQKPLQSLLTVAVVATSVAVSIVVMLLASSIQRGLIAATDPFDLIVGAKGSPNQLVLNTVFLQDVPIGNIDYDLVGELAANPLVQTAIPLGFGDNYRGYRIVGTENSLFEHRSKAASQGPWIELLEGRPFAAPFEAVIGAKTAQELGLKIGDQFASSHGVVAGGEAHEQHKFTVVGIFKPLQGPYDRALLVPLASIWELHEHGHEGHEAAVRSEPEHDHGSEKGTTVILVKPKGYAEAMRLYQEFQKEPRAQLIFPAQVVVQLFAVLGEGEKILKMIGYAVFAMALLLVSFSLYWSSLSRSRDRAVLRAIGAGWRDIFAIILSEGLFLVWSGILLGIIFGHAVFAALAAMLAQKTAVSVIASVSAAEGYTVLAILLVGALASLIPAITTARSSIAADL